MFKFFQVASFFQLAPTRGGMRHRKRGWPYDLKGLLCVLTLLGLNAQLSEVVHSAAPLEAVLSTESNQANGWSFSLSPQVAKTDLFLVYSSNLNGELEPCGCSAASDYGGLKRMASLIEALRDQARVAEVPLLLLSGGGLLDDFSAQEKIKNQYILTGLSLMNYDAIALQPRDLSFGVSFIKAFGQLPWVNTIELAKDLNPAEEDFASVKFFDYDHQRIGFYSVELPQSFASMKTIKLDAVFEQLAERFQTAKKDGVINIVFTTLSPEELAEKGLLPYIDVVMSPSHQPEFKTPTWIDQTLWLQPGHRGMKIGIAQLSFKSNDTAAITLLAHDEVTLDNGIPDSASLMQWYSDYNEAVARAYEQTNALKKQFHTEQSPYLGEQVCVSCHQSIHHTWKQSDHSRAHDSLVKKGKALDPACLTCHTVAFHQAGGFIDMTVSAHLANVQCENCHIQTRPHLSNPTNNKPKLAANSAELVCKTCHNKTHSPDFSFESYWPRIAHPSP